jgi:hypothetical protein
MLDKVLIREYNMFCKVKKESKERRKKWLEFGSMRSYIS